MANGQQGRPQPDTPLPLTFSSGMNNRDTPLGLYLARKGQSPNLVNVDATYLGKLKLQRPFLRFGDVDYPSKIISILRANDWIFVGTDQGIVYYSKASDPGYTSLKTGLSGDYITMAHAGNWIYAADSTNKFSIYIGGTVPVVCDWGLAIPPVPLVDTGVAGNPNGTYTCGYRYKITLPDGTILRTAVSTTATVAPATQKIEWSGIVHAAYTGATTNQVELLRFKSGWAATYVVTTLDSGTTTYSDDGTDAAVQALDTYAETGYYPPPANIDQVIYHPGADRMFMVVDNDVYWSEAGLYNIVLYSDSLADYSNVNSVYLSGELVTALAMVDEQLYVGSKRTWTRLRGKSPDYWKWETTSAHKGPVAWRANVTTPFGAIYPASDGALYLFQGIDAKRIAEHFIFDTTPTSASHATWDGRVMRLFYGDATYPEVVLDFYGWPSNPIRAFLSTRDHTASFYHPGSGTLYLGDENGVFSRGEDDLNTEVAMTIQTAEIPIDKIINVGDAAVLYVDVNTQGETLTITPYYDDEEQDPVTVVTASRKIEPVPLPEGTYRTLYFEITITTKEAIELREPWFVGQSDDD